MPAPIKKYKSGNFDMSLWENEKDFGKGGVVAFKTITLRKTWRDNKNTARDQRIILRQQDVEKVLVMLRKMQEYLVLEGKK
jgi:hypothetical protein